MENKKENDKKMDVITFFHENSSDFFTFEKLIDVFEYPKELLKKILRICIGNKLIGITSDKSYYFIGKTFKIKLNDIYDETNKFPLLKNHRDSDRIIVLSKPYYVPYDHERCGVIYDEYNEDLEERMIFSGLSCDNREDKLFKQIKKVVALSPNFKDNLKNLFRYFNQKYLMEIHKYIYLHTEIISYCVWNVSDFKELENELKLLDNNFNKHCPICRSEHKPIFLLDLFFNDTLSNQFLKKSIKELQEIIKIQTDYISGGCCNTTRPIWNYKYGIICEKCYRKMFNFE